MDDRIRERVQGFVDELLREEKSSLKKARTLLEIENQAIEIGDELVRQLANSDLAQRAEKVAQQTEHLCPDCGKMRDLEADTEPLILQGKRSEIEYSEPRCHCPSCRRDFFPSGERT